MYFSCLVNQISSFFFSLSLYRNQAMRKKLILYFKRRNHARKQWVSDSRRPYFICIKQRNLLCEKEKDDFQQRGAATPYFSCCITVESLLLKITCEGEVPDPAAGSTSLPKCFPQSKRVGLV